MNTDSSVADATSRASTDVVGCRLVARLNFRRCESGATRYAGGRLSTWQNPKRQYSTEWVRAPGRPSIGLRYARRRGPKTTRRTALALAIDREEARSRTRC